MVPPPLLTRLKVLLPEKPFYSDSVSFVDRVSKTPVSPYGRHKLPVVIPPNPPTSLRPFPLRHRPLQYHPLSLSLGPGRLSNTLSETENQSLSDPCLVTELD